MAFDTTSGISKSWVHFSGVEPPTIVLCRISVTDVDIEVSGQATASITLMRQFEVIPEKKFPTENLILFALMSLITIDIWNLIINCNCYYKREDPEDPKAFDDSIFFKGKVDKF